jgi:hypothetical protein
MAKFKDPDMEETRRLLDAELRATKIEGTLSKLSERFGFDMTTDMINYVAKKAKTTTPQAVTQKAFDYLKKEHPQEAVKWEMQYYEKKGAYINPETREKALALAEKGKYGLASQALATQAKRKERFEPPASREDIIATYSLGATKQSFANLAKDIGLPEKIIESLPTERREIVEERMQMYQKLSGYSTKYDDSSAKLAADALRQAYIAAYDPNYFKTSKPKTKLDLVASRA